MCQHSPVAGNPEIRSIDHRGLTIVELYSEEWESSSEAISHEAVGCESCDRPLVSLSISSWTLGMGWHLPEAA